VRLQLSRTSRESERLSEERAQSDALRRSAAAANPTAAVQTEWISMILPLPTPQKK